MPRFGGAPAPAASMRLSPEAASLRVADWFPAGMLSRITLVDMVRHVQPHLVRDASVSTEWLLGWVAQALRDGQLEAHVLHRTIQLSAGAGQTEPVPPPRDEPTPESKEDKTWIAIQLVDDQGKPIAYKRYRIELPNGSTNDGMLDENGMARVDGIDPGTCEVSFPDLHTVDWWPAQEATGT